jgi:hypothetical protein
MGESICPTCGQPVATPLAGSPPQPEADSAGPFEGLHARYVAQRARQLREEAARENARWNCHCGFYVG